MITKEQLAERLNGNMYMEEFESDDEVLAKESGLLIVFGYSDDNVELRGVIYDEISAYHGTTITLHNGKVLSNRCDDEDCPYFHQLVNSATDKIIAHCDKDGYSWVMESNLPFAPFDIMEDGQKFCRGIVVDMAPKRKEA